MDRPKRGRGRPSTFPEPWRTLAEQAGGVGKLAEQMGVDPRTVRNYAHGGPVPASKKKLIDFLTKKLETD